MIKTNVSRKTKLEFQIDSEIRQFTIMLEEASPILKSTAIHYFRRLFATDRKLTKIPEDSEFYPRIAKEVVKFLRAGVNQEDIKTDAIWVITNMCCLSQNVNHILVNEGCIEILMKNLNSPLKKLSNQCIWALANIAADCTECKLRCRSLKLYRKLVQKLTKDPFLERTDRKNLFWCMNNLTAGGRVTVPNDLARSMITALASNLFSPMTGEPDESAPKILWSLANIADDIDNLLKIDMVLEQPGLVANCMLYFLDPSYSKLHTAALRLIGNVAVGNDEQTDRLLNFPYFRMVLEHGMSRSQHCSEIAWICSNIAAGEARHVDYLLDEEFYAWILKGVHSTERRLRKECLWVIANMMATGDDKQMEILIDMGVVHQLPELLAHEDVRLNEKALNASMQVVREFPCQHRLFYELNILEHINEELLDEDAPPYYRTQKRQIEMMLEQNRRSARIVENGVKMIRYTKFDF